MTSNDYPLPKDPAGPFDCTVLILGEVTNSENENRDVFVSRCRAHWNLMPTLRDCQAYIIHGKSELAK